MGDTLVEAIGAAQGGVLGLIATMPIETVQKTQVVLQSQDERQDGAREILERLMRNGGITALYRGFPVLCTMVASEKFLYYLVYTFGKKRAANGGTLSLASNILLGYLADIARSVTFKDKWRMVSRMYFLPPPGNTDTPSTAGYQ